MTKVGRPTLTSERQAWAEGHRRVAGLDEVGRGPLAGPVVAGAVVLPYPVPERLLRCGIRDSKQLSPQARARLAPLIREHAVGAGVGLATSEEIDELGIVWATRQAMLRALESLAVRPDLLLIDALPLPQAGIPFRAIIHGDALCLSIAAASIVAKVARDRMMVEMDAEHPGYGFARHKGYGTAEHLASLARLGPTPQHRRTFAPVRLLAEADRG
ncbi:MAG: ribonuclease HII [Dehalococcoidia bacterium]|nr:ribonuclease HII [Dehalococcoidia bacterium]